MIKLFALHDSDTELRKFGSFEVDFQRAKELNKQGYGIFLTFNDFTGARKKTNLQKINYWACDIDEGSKEEQMQRIKALLFQPTIIVESNKGFHCYWKARNGVIQDYERIANGIAYKLKADKACKDPLRLLRMPNYYHMKNPNKPFLVKVIEKNKNEYTNEEMKFYFSIQKKRLRPIKITGDKSKYFDEKNWESYFKISRICKGNRNNRLYYVVRRCEDLGLSNSETEYIVKSINNKITESLSENEVNQILRGRRIIWANCKNTCCRIQK